MALQTQLAHLSFAIICLSTIIAKMFDVNVFFNYIFYLKYQNIVFDILKKAFCCKLDFYLQYTNKFYIFM